MIWKFSTIISSSIFSGSSIHSAKEDVSLAHRLGGLNNQHLFVAVLGVGKSKIKGVTDLVSGEDPLSGS